MNANQFLLDFTRRVIATMDLSDLPAERRRKLREIIEELVYSRITTALLSEIEESGLSEEFLARSETADDVSDVFVAMIELVPQAEAILEEELEMLFENLTGQSLLTSLENE